MGSRNTHRRLTFLLSTSALTSNVGLAVLFYHLPDDPLHLARNLCIYSAFAAVISLLGIIGAKIGNAVMVAAFANYLFLDILVCTIPRIFAMITLPDLKSSICSADSIKQWLESQSQDVIVNASGVAQQDRYLMFSRQMSRQCEKAVGVLSLLAAGFSIGWTIVQLLLVLRVSAYAAMLQSERGNVAKPTQVLIMAMRPHIPTDGQYRDEPSVPVNTSPPPYTTPGNT